MSHSYGSEDRFLLSKIFSDYSPALYETLYDVQKKLVSVNLDSKSLHVSQTAISLLPPIFEKPFISETCFDQVLIPCIRNVHAVEFSLDL
jgi:hypothetical protein